MRAAISSFFSSRAKCPASSRWISASGTLLRLPWLAPDITAAIVNGRQPPQLNAMKLMRQASRLSADWSEQRTLLGFC